MRLISWLFVITTLSALPCCGPLALYDSGSVADGETSTLNFEISPNFSIEEIVVNGYPVNPPRSVRVKAGDQQISFKFVFEDTENDTIVPSTKGTCDGSFYARPEKSYSITPSAVWLNEAHETRFWVVSPVREQVTAFNCTKVTINAGVQAPVAEKNLSDESSAAPRAGSAWDTIMKPFREKDVEPVDPAAAREKNRY